MNFEKAFHTFTSFFKIESKIFLLESTYDGSCWTNFLVKDEATYLNRSYSVSAETYLESLSDIFYLIFNLSN